MILEKKRSVTLATREPFPLIAYEAGGNFARYLVVVSSYLQLIGVAVIFLLIASHNIAEVLSVFVLSFCDYTIIITIIMWPVAMLGTPKGMSFEFVEEIESCPLYCKSDKRLLSVIYYHSID